jgi:hypothetical protein
MARVLERIRWPQKKQVVVHSSTAPEVELRVLELQAAKEILAEIFGVRISDVEMMERSRLRARTGMIYALLNPIL